MLSIRQINDSILHTIPFKVNFDDDEHLKQLHSAIKIMQENLHEYGGVGIAANQCKSILNPPQIFIIGTNDPDKAKLRYPGKLIPPETIMINPTIINYSMPYYPKTGEGCLSVNGCIRARIKRYENVTIQYYDIDRNLHTQTFHDFISHIIQHEYDHLQGNVYLQKIIEDLNKDQIIQILSTINYKEVLLDRNTRTPLMIFDRDNNNQILIILENLKIAINETHDITLEGIKALLHKKLISLNTDETSCSHNLSFNRPAK